MITRLRRHRWLVVATYIVVGAALLVYVIVLFSQPSPADDDQNPAPGVRYCPDTGQVVPIIPGVTASCPSLFVGPYTPGGLQPNRQK